MKTQTNRKVFKINAHEMGNEEYCMPQLESWSLRDFPEVYDACGDVMTEELGNEISVYPSW